jgi:hypothetical protein
MGGSSNVLPAVPALRCCWVSVGRWNTRPTNFWDGPLPDYRFAAGSTMQRWFQDAAGAGAWAGGLCAGIPSGLRAQRSSTVDAFLALAFVGTFTGGSILAFLTFGPMVDIKSTLMFLGVFKRKTVAYLILLPLLLTMLVGIWVNLNVNM